MQKCYRIKKSQEIEIEDTVITPTDSRYLFKVEKEMNEKKQTYQETESKFLLACNSRKIRPASIVLPKPTSSANIAPLLNGDLKANKAASTW